MLQAACLCCIPMKRMRFQRYACLAGAVDTGLEHSVGTQSKGVE